jgi:hypothetical protein
MYGMRTERRTKRCFGEEWRSANSLEESTIGVAEGCMPPAQEKKAAGSGAQSTGGSAAQDGAQDGVRSVPPQCPPPCA